MGNADVAFVIFMGVSYVLLCLFWIFDDTE